MATRNNCRSARPAGFTLVELMIVIVIGSILMTIAIPAYQSQIRKSRRTEARTAVLDLASKEERWLSTNNAYTNDAFSLGYAAAAGTAWTAVPAIGGGYYKVKAEVFGNPATTYLITATATGIQTADTQCATFTVTQLGQQAATDSGGATSTAINTTCWG
jgi:type IV pilus assembly protein PilE